MQVFSASRPELIHPFTGLQPAQFYRLVRLIARRGGDTIADGRPGRPWALTLPDRVLLVAVYWRKARRRAMKDYGSSPAPRARARYPMRSELHH
jgi:hypothetical protein